MAEVMSARFSVVKSFRMLRTRDGSVVDDGKAPENRNLPILGEYHAGHDYAVTPLNSQAVKAAVAAGQAKLLL